MVIKAMALRSLPLLLSSLSLASFDTHIWSSLAQDHLFSPYFYSVQATVGLLHTTGSENRKSSNELRRSTRYLNLAYLTTHFDSWMLSTKVVHCGLPVLLLLLWTQATEAISVLSWAKKHWPQQNHNYSKFRTLIWNTLFNCYWQINSHIFS